MRFGEKVRQLRKARNLNQRALAEVCDVSFTYISKIENHKLDFGDFPSAAVIERLATALGTDATDLLVLARKVPEPIRRRVLERPDAFRKLALLNDAALDRLVALIDGRDESPLPTATSNSTTSPPSN